MNFKTETVKPILFMVFNRPDKTARVWEQISKAKPRKLYVAADAPRVNVESDVKKCADVREIVTNIDWECDVKYLFHESNKGCSLAGKSAWDWFFDQEDEMIFIEDDGLFSLSFLYFAQEMLEKYKDDHRIAYISGENIGIKYGIPNSYFFSRFFGGGTYAMATWKRVYDLYEYRLDSFYQIKDTLDYRRNFLNRLNFIHQNRRYKYFIENGGNTYDLQMGYLLHKYNMFNINPNVNMCSNIGFDLDGSNTSVNPNSKGAKKFGNRPRFELTEIIHPKEFFVDRKTEIMFFKKKVLQDRSMLTGVLWIYILLPIKNYLNEEAPFFRNIYRKALKMLRIRSKR